MFILFLLAIVLSILLRFTDSDYPFGTQGRIQGAHPARATPKIGKNMIFWRKIVIFHKKYPKQFRAPLRSAQFF
jgi:hypothetical protein